MTNTHHKRKCISGEFWMLGKSHTSQSLSLHFHHDPERTGEVREGDDTHVLQGLPWPRAQTGDLYHRNTFDHSLLDERSRRSYWRVCFCMTSLCTYVAGCGSPCVHDCPSVHLEASNTITVSSKRVRTSTHEFGGGLWPNSWQDEGIYFDSRFRGGLISIHLVLCAWAGRHRCGSVRWKRAIYINVVRKQWTAIGRSRG